MICSLGAAKMIPPLLILWSSANSKAYAQNLWQRTGGPYGGFVRAIAVNSAGDLFAGTMGRGVFRSTNNGDSWTDYNTSLTNLHVQSLAINSNGYIFAGRHKVSWTQVAS